MSHEEITTKIELPSTTPSSNIVHIDFVSRSAQRQPKAKRTASGEPGTVAPIITSGRSRLFPRLSEIDLESPWILRLVAVLFILVLSMLVL